MVDRLFSRSWVKLPFDAAVLQWAKQAWKLGQEAMNSPDMALWWVCEDTWFVGVDALPNDTQGRLPDGTTFPSVLSDAVQAHFGTMPDLHRAQLSVVRPGYPKPRDGETPAAFRYRQNRDAAHVDGLRKSPDGGRRIEEPHAWIMGVPLTENTADQAPLVIWEGSHEIMKAAFLDHLESYPKEDWHLVDLREVYEAARKQVFDSCPRVKILSKPGEAILLHRLALHGIAPWSNELPARETECRAVVYFRPEMAKGAVFWALNT